jgi:hypothetical protein
MHRDDEAPLLPKFDYHLDGSDPDLLVLRRQDDAFVAAFSARGATKEGVLEAAQDDYRALIREHAGPLGLESGRSEAEAPEHRARPIHRSAWKGCSANSACRGFSEVGTGLPKGASCPCRATTASGGP